MRNSRSRLKKALEAVKKDYDVIVLDCPPSIATLSENIFRSSDAILVPIIPTTLSQRTFEQLVEKGNRKAGWEIKLLAPNIRRYR